LANINYTKGVLFYFKKIKIRSSNYSFFLTTDLFEHIHDERVSDHNRHRYMTEKGKGTGVRGCCEVNEVF